MKTCPTHLSEQLATARATAVSAVCLTPFEGRNGGTVGLDAQGPAEDAYAHVNLEAVLEEYFRLHALLVQPLSDQLAERGGLQDLAALSPLLDELCKVGKNICQINISLGRYGREALVQRFVKLTANGQSEDSRK